MKAHFPARTPPPPLTRTILYGGLGAVWLLAGTLPAPLPAQAPVGAGDERRCVVLELYVRAGEDASDRAAELVGEMAKTRPGLVVARRDITQSTDHQERFQRVARHFRVSDTTTPLVYACNRVISGFQDEDDFQQRLGQMLRVEVFVRHGCARCDNARQFLQQFFPRYAGLELTYREITRDRQALADMNRLVAQHRAGAASVPVFHICNRLIIGFSGAASTQNRLEATLQRWTTPCAPHDSATPPDPAGPDSSARGGPAVWPRLTDTGRDPTRQVALVPLAVPWVWLAAGQAGSAPPRPAEPPQAEPTQVEPPQAEPPQVEPSFFLPLPDRPGEEPQAGELPLPADDQGPSLAADGEQRSVQLPFFGEVSVQRVGLPALTLAVGLIDGFNPCAMWVLLFLLSLLVNLQDRRKILIIAGTFILISGLAYFAFMAAWLNVFLLVGYLRPIQIALGLIAIAVGSVHIKDFFALHRGFSLSIPEAAKPGIYARTRQIITAENLWGALIGASVLAVMVNIVELLCTAGLPALYTEILTMQNLPAWQNYAYLALYNVGYMFDDALMVGLVVITLSKRKLQEGQGRWLKLISGVVIAALGATMIFKPELLV